MVVLSIKISESSDGYLLLSMSKILFLFTFFISLKIYFIFYLLTNVITTWFKKVLNMFLGSINILTFIFNLLKKIIE